MKPPTNRPGGYSLTFVPHSEGHDPKDGTTGRFVLSNPEDAKWFYKPLSEAEKEYQQFLIEQRKKYIARHQKPKPSDNPAPNPAE